MASECTKFVLRRGSARTQLGRGALGAPPDPLVGWGGGAPLPIPLPLDAFSVSVPAPSAPFALHPNFVRSRAARLGLPISWFTDSSQMCLNENIIL